MEALRCSGRLSPAEHLLLFVPAINSFNQSNTSGKRGEIHRANKASRLSLSPGIDLKASQAFTLERDAGSIDRLFCCVESPSWQRDEKKNLSGF